MNLTSEWQITHIYTSSLHQPGGQSTSLHAWDTHRLSIRPLSSELWYISPERTVTQPVSAIAPAEDERCRYWASLNKKGEVIHHVHFWDTQRVKLAADETKNLSEKGEADLELSSNGADRPTSSPHGKIIRVKLERNIPMTVPLPVQVQPDPAHQLFPFLDTALADLGIQQWVSQERLRDVNVVLVCQLCACVCIQGRGEGEGGVGWHHEDPG